MNYKIVKFSFPELWLSLIMGFLFSIVIAQAVYADENHNGAHVHGVAHLNLALENNELYIEIKSPAANIVGFEHSPETEKEKKAVKEAVQTLKAGDKLIIFSSHAGVVLKESRVMTGMENESDHESEHNHSETDHHNHQEAEDNKQHSEFEVVYHFDCTHPKKLNFIDVMLFDRYKGIEKIKAQIMTGTKQTALVLTPSKNRIKF